MANSFEISLAPGILRPPEGEFLSDQEVSMTKGKKGIGKATLLFPTLTAAAIQEVCGMRDDMPAKAPTSLTNRSLILMVILPRIDFQADALSKVPGVRKEARIDHEKPGEHCQDQAQPGI
jgi:hypothetical protein